MADWVVVIAGLKVYWLSLIVVVAFLWGAYIFFRQAVENHFEEPLIYDGILMAGILSLVLSRVIFAILNPGFVAGNWSKLLLFAEFPGLSVWGVPAGVILTCWWVAVRTKTSIYDWLDMAVLGLVAGWVIGRAGMAALDIEGLRLLGLPISLYEAVFMAGLYWVLWWLEKEYRTFIWYRYRRTEARSGLVAGTGLAGIALFQLVNLWPFRWNIVGVATIFAVVVAMILVVYTRSGRSFGLKIRLKNARKKEE